MPRKRPFRDHAKGSDVRKVVDAGDGLAIGARLPLAPAEKMKVRPASWIDDTARGPRGVFRNGRGSVK